MSTYCISDVHANVTALKKLLEKIEFKYDGSDRLYLLGDYVDWGENSINTLEFIMELSRYPFVTCLMGNHDYMFLGEILLTDCGLTENNFDENWLISNRGIVTWNGYIKLPLVRREEIRDWLAGLEFSAEVKVGDDWYLLGHAGPYLPQGDDADPDADFADREFAVWNRMRSAVCNPLEFVFDNYPLHIWEEKQYKTFICGHTIADHYIKDKSKPCAIFKGKHFIDIDCGGKCMFLNSAQEGVSREYLSRYRLAALRLEDMAEFYCDRKEAGY